MKKRIKPARAVGRKWSRYEGLVYIFPWIAGFLLFQLYPFLASLSYSFTDYAMVGSMKWVGLDNFITILTKDRDFWSTIKITLIYVFIAVPLKLLFALFIAMLLNCKVKGIGIFRTAYYLPSILGGSVAISVLWRFLFMRDGTVNTMLSWFGIRPVGWLSDPKIALFTLSLLAVWQFGSSMVIFLSALKNVPAELYESARVDGASSPRCFLSITIPMITPTILFNMIMQVISAFQEFTGAFVITNGGPMKSTYLYILKVYDEAFKFFKMGYACALSWILFLFIVVFTVIIFKTSDAWVFYSDGGEAI